MSEQSTLTQFGPTFQSKIISALLSDTKFLATISDILDTLKTARNIIE